MGDLYAAILSQDCARVQELIDAGHDINCKDQFGNTPLHFACMVSNLDIVKILLNVGADPNIRDADGKKAGELASDDTIREYMVLLEKS